MCIMNDAATNVDLGIEIGIELSPENIMKLFSQQSGRSELHFLRRSPRGDWLMCSVLETKLDQTIIENNFTHGCLRSNSLMPILY